MKLNAVFDTNLLISGILWKGTPFQIVVIIVKVKAQRKIRTELL